jgi:hypothetical protein
MVNGAPHPEDVRIEQVRQLAFVAGLVEAQRVISNTLDIHIAKAHENRVSLRDLARTLDSSPETVRRRISAHRKKKPG